MDITPSTEREVDHEFTAKLYVQVCQMTDNYSHYRTELIWMTVIATLFAILMATGGRSDNDLGYGIGALYALGFLLVSGLLMQAGNSAAEGFIETRRKLYYQQMSNLEFLPLSPGHRLRWPLIRHFVLAILFILDLHADRLEYPSAYTVALKQYYSRLLQSKRWPYIDGWSLMEGYAVLGLLLAYAAFVYCAGMGYITGGSGITWREVPSVAVVSYTLLLMIYLNTTRRLAWSGALLDILHEHSELWLRKDQRSS